MAGGSTASVWRDASGVAVGDASRCTAGDCTALRTRADGRGSRGGWVWCSTAVGWGATRSRGGCCDKLALIPNITLFSQNSPGAWIWPSLICETTDPLGAAALPPLGGEPEPEPPLGGEPLPLPPLGGDPLPLPPLGGEPLPLPPLGLEPVGVAIS